MRKGPGIDRIVLGVLARQLIPLLDEVLFVGGHVAELLVTAPGVTRVRPTFDVDLVVSARTRMEYHTFERRLIALGFRPDLQPEGGLICRWRSPTNLVLDVLPVEEAVLGFSNPWYGSAFESAVTVRLEEDLKVKIPAPPLFLAMKWSAYEGRGEGLLRESHDVEDIITVVAGRPSILAEIRSAPNEVRDWLSLKANEFLAHAESADALTGALPDAFRIPELIPLVRGRFERMRNQDYEE